MERRQHVATGIGERLVLRQCAHAADLAEHEVYDIGDQSRAGIVQWVMQLAIFHRELVDFIPQGIVQPLANRFDAVLPLDDQGQDRRCGADRIGCRHVQRHHELVLVERMAGVAGNG